MSKNSPNFLPKAIIGGYERGGTTFLSEWLRSAGYSSFFEIGVLLYKNPHLFSNDNIYHRNLQKYLKQKGCKVNLNYGEIEDFYSSIFHQIQNKEDLYFDKTPKYMEVLGEVIERAEFCKKFLIISRDPRCVMYSWAKRQKSETETYDEYINNNLKQLAERYLNYYFGSIAYIEDPKVLFLKYEDLCLDYVYIKEVLENFLDIKINISDVFERKSNYENVSKGFDFEKPFEAILELNKDLQYKILDQTKQAAIFFHNDQFKPEFLKEWTSNFIDIKKLIQKYNLQNHSLKTSDGKGIIDPLYYYLKNLDVLKAKKNALDHFENFGAKEGRHGR